MYVDSTCVLNSISNVKNSVGRVTQTSSTFARVPCYLSEEAGSRNTNGNEAVTYTHMLFINYLPGVDTSMTVVHEDLVYDITGVWAAPRKHHLELGLTRRSV